MILIIGGDSISSNASCDEAPYRHLCRECVLTSSMSFYLVFCTVS